MECFRNVTVPSGDQKDYDKFATKLRSQIVAENHRVSQIMRVVHHDCTEEGLINHKFDECSPTRTTRTSSLKARRRCTNSCST